MDVVAQVRAAMAGGSRTRKEIALTAQMDIGVVDAVVDLLVRMDAVDVHTLKFECGAGGCGNCLQDATCAPGPLPVTIRTRTTPKP